ncbi:multicopper oxidase [Scheffersomyces xylosifermentans]|uniref:multicopper oxidase n=1 Tax=Scheffersomyces xylosifermentans TaxID=1304137 RepID=UPI00315DE69F
MLVLHSFWWLLCALTVAAKTHTFYFNATYVNASPDGTIERRMVGINNKWPIPTIRVKKNDRVKIHFTNLLNENSSLHFHGLFQEGTNAMDGPDMVTQCPVAPGTTFLFDFEVKDQAGTYWYHSHSGAQYSDGLRGLFIVEDDVPLAVDYDEEVTLTVSDFYHDVSGVLVKNFMSRYNPTGAEPIPQNALFNETRNASWVVEPNKTYLLRIANMGIFTSQYLFIENHNFTIIEADGVYVEPREVDSLYLASAQRYSVLVHTKDTVDKNFRFVNILDQDMLDFLPEDLEVISTNWMVYNKKNPLPKPLKNDNIGTTFQDLLKRLNPVDDFYLVPLSKEKLLPDADVVINLDFTMEPLGDGVTYAAFNGISYVPPKVPTLMSVFSSGKYADNSQIYGSNTNSFVIQPNEVVDIVLNNMDPGKHPFHLHGHTFQIISRSPEGQDEENPIKFDPSNSNHTDYPEYPMIRDTVQVHPNGFFVIRFKANNPGVWFFHCHVDWHLEQGLAITLIESPFEIQKQEIIQNHYDSCNRTNIPSYGNAAANYGETKEAWLNLEGENLQVAPLPEGFTQKGYIALVLCTIIAIYGIFSIYKYGMEDVTSEDTEAMIAKLYDILRKNGDTVGNEYHDEAEEPLT